MKPTYGSGNLVKALVSVALPVVGVVSVLAVAVALGVMVGPHVPVGTLVLAAVVAVASTPVVIAASNAALGWIDMQREGRGPAN